ncbi:uncharacterized protein LTR77_001022 [Saxophila tyrrhenica]|uniref:NAD(P)-binding protein n=1 Tax=Saxophila tyrrhenica TaxID=1690608 RepID=A0AAV9PSI2_9PEZI|nr:hypothetical protein LTR77_001022 [Saxophila tyrrhenica]
MVTLSEVRATNSKLSQPPMTAVFVGATSGIGLATLRAFSTHVAKPHAIIIGRSRSTFEPELENLRKINPEGNYTYFEADVSLMRNIDAVCSAITKYLNGGKIDLLFTSQGSLSFSGRHDTVEGLDLSVALRYYGRVRFTQLLLPHMNPKGGRAITVLAGTQEGKIFEDDLDLKQNYGLANAAGHFASLLSLSYDSLAAQHPGVGFVHVFPGLASTGLLGRSAEGALGVLMRWVVQPVLGLFIAKPEDVGERMWWLATQEGFVGGEGVAWTVDEKGEVGVNAVLKGYRERGLAGRVVEHNEMVSESTRA